MSEASATSCVASVYLPVLANISAIRVREDTGLYLARVRQLPLLTAEQELHYATGARSGEQSARNRMICHNLRLVISIARKYQRPGVSFIDLIAEGNLGLIRAVEKFDPGLGYRFSTYASWWVQQAVERAVERQSVVVRPRRLLLQRRREQKNWQHAQPGVNSSLGKDVSFDENPGIQTEETLCPSPCREIEQEQILLQLRQWLACLPAAQQQILVLYFGLYGTPQHTLLQISEHMCLSRQKVARQRDQALDSLRRTLACHGLDATSLLRGSV